MSSNAEKKKSSVICDNNQPQQWTAYEFSYYQYTFDGIHFLLPTIKNLVFGSIYKIYIILESGWVVFHWMWHYL